MLYTEEYRSGQKMAFAINQSQMDGLAKGKIMEIVGGLTTGS